MRAVRCDLDGEAGMDVARDSEYLSWQIDVIDASLAPRSPQRLPCERNLNAPTTVRFTLNSIRQRNFA